jgi:hypothetical protein
MFAVIKMANLRECIKLSVVVWWMLFFGGIPLVKSYWIFFEDCFIEYFFRRIEYFTV